jgi:hypothetical protein
MQIITQKPSLNIVPVFKDDSVDDFIY